MKKANEAYNKGDIILVTFPFTDFSGEKRRPALVVGISEEHAVVAFITTQKTGPRRWIVPLAASAKTGLLTPSYARCDKILSVDIKITGGAIGISDQGTMKAVDSKLRTLLKL